MITPDLVALAMILAGPVRPGRVWNYVAVGDSAWYQVRTANARIGRLRGPMLRFQTMPRVTVIVTREARP